MDLGFLFQIAAVFLGGSSVQLIVFLIRRRSELGEMDAKADAVSLEASNNLITRLQLDGEQLRAQIVALRAEHLIETEEMTRRLTACTEQGVRLQREIALLRNDIVIAQKQIDQLAPPGPGPGDRGGSGGSAYRDYRRL